MSPACVSPPRWWRTPPWPPPELSPVPLHRCDVLPPSPAPFRLVGPGARRLPAAGEEAGLSPPQVFEMEGGLLPVRPRMSRTGDQTSAASASREITTEVAQRSRWMLGSRWKPPSSTRVNSGLEDPIRLPLSRPCPLSTE